MKCSENGAREGSVSQAVMGRVSKNARSKRRVSGEGADWNQRLLPQEAHLNTDEK